MATTKITSNVLAPNAAQNNINSGASFSVSIPTQFTNTLTANSSVTIDSSSSVANPKLLILATSTWGSDDNSVLVIKGSGINKVASVNLRNTGGSGELYNGWISGRVGGGIVINNSFFVNNGGSGPQTGNTSFSVLNTGKVGVGTSTPISNLDVFGSLATSTPTDVLILTRSFNSGVAFPSAASFKLSNPATSTTNTRLDISLLNANSSVPIAPDTTVMSLVSNGNVGIGTTTPSEKLTVSGNIIASGSVTANNLVYTTGDQAIAGTKTFNNNIVVNNTITAPNQTLASTGALINSNLLISLLQDTSIGIYARQGTNTGSNNQYAVQGTIGFSATPVAGSAMYIQYYFDKQGLVHNTAITSAGGGSQIKYDRPFILSFGFTTPSSSTAQDVDIRLLYGPPLTGGTSNARVVSISGTNFGGVGLKITKHPTNNTYLTRMFSRPFALNNPVNITNCSNASPIVVSTLIPHNMVTGDMVEITGVTGNTAANGEWNIVKINDNSFSLTNSVGNGTYTASGTIVKLTTSFLELNPNYYYRAHFKWNPLTSVVTLHLGDHNAVASLSVSLPNNAALQMVSHQTGHVFTAGIASITYNAGFLGMTVSPPSMYQSFLI